MKRRYNAYIDEQGITVWKDGGSWKVKYKDKESTITPPVDRLDCAYSIARQVCWLYGFVNKEKK